MRWSASTKEVSRSTGIPAQTLSEWARYGRLSRRPRFEDGRYKWDNALIEEAVKRWKLKKRRPASGIATTSPVSRVIFQEMDRRELPIARVAKDVGYAPNSITSWRKGHRTMSIVAAENFADYLGLKLEVVKKDA